MMKKTAILTLSAVLASQLMGAEDLSEMIKEGKAGGYIRIHHIFPEASDTIAEAGSVIGGKLKYQTGGNYMICRMKSITWQLFHWYPIILRFLIKM